LSLTVKTDDVTKGRQDVDPHGAVTGGSEANGLIKNIGDTISKVIVFTDKFESLFKFEPLIVS